MEIAIVAVGRLKDGPERELCGRYLARAEKSGRALGLRGFDVLEIAESKAARTADRVAAEAEALGAAANRGGRIVCLDGGGDLLDSEGFTARLRRGVDGAVPRTSFVIGGPDGLAAEFLARADERLSFGRLTWPHQLVRIMLAEQLYRAVTILSGHPYHRA